MPGATGLPGQAASSCHQSVRIGTDYSGDEGAAFAAVGDPTQAAQANAYAAQVKAQRQLMANYINSTGGLGGCPITLDLYNFSSLNSNGGADESQKECTYLAQDHHDFVVIPEEFETPLIVQCDAASHVPTIVDSLSIHIFPGPADYSRYAGYLYAPDDISVFQLGGEIGWLQTLGFWSGAKVGVLEPNDGTNVQQALVNDYWKPALANLGIAPVVCEYTASDSVSSLSSNETAWSSCILQFKGAGVNRLLIAPDGGAAAFFFSQEASSQKFYPRYALNTWSGINAWSSVTKDEQAGAVGMSFQPIDFATNTDAGALMAARSNPAQATCLKVYKGESQQTIAGNLPWCSDLLFLQAALKGAATVSPQTLQAGVGRLGTTQPLANVYGPADFGPSRDYGAGFIQPMTFNTATQNWEYAGSPFPVS